ncbi:hypothetical protein MKW94_009544 [Papaver nudicaule]|uniref:SKP1-like protein n=1 Tax=Papaver nudicaule TaxID=74823 RepID=A0AA42B3H9_PAPNU|nr:hypothetical protein [Papaver nudicaule]MCL7052206.1 hypothetical protein [Papaver nudicaule]
MKSLKIDEKQPAGSSLVFGVVGEEGSSSSNGKKKKKKKKPNSSQRKKNKGKKPEETTTEKAKEKTVLLRTGEGDTFEVEQSIVLSSQTIQSFIEDSSVAENILVPLNNISSDILENVLVYLEKHEENKVRSVNEKQELVKWEEDFVKELKTDKGTLFEMVLAADQLGARGLMDVLCQAIADMIMDMTTEEVREFFGIENDFTPEEEAAVRAQAAWWLLQNE